MTVCCRLVVGEVLKLFTQLTVDIAWEVPVHIWPVACDGRPHGALQYSVALVVDLLEKERRVVSTKVPSANQKRICRAIERRASRGMSEIAEVIVVTVDDDGTIADVIVAYFAAVVPIRRSSANTFRKSKGEETNASHKEED